ncbi:MAG TPA: HEAT repeat domain-containing protein [Armatimonadota bacterium]|nr:HEAT repeat domain-containing protein [Armatimonadota bacterium]
MSSAPVLLDDSAMKRFITDGYIVLKPQMPEGLNEQVYERLEKVIVGRGNPENNILPWVPELRQVLDHPVVDGALRSILGADYYLHLHRHVHDNRPGSKGQKLHKDSLYNSRFAVDDTRRHHRTRWVMLFYYPQDTPLEMGPTAIVPKSQYLNIDAPTGVDEVALSGEAGTVTLVHYDLLHKGMANRTEKIRYMAKFLFTRMSEPKAPSWNHTTPHWDSDGDPQEGIWRHVWDWHCGASDTESPSASDSVEALAGRLGDDSEIAGLSAAYELGLRGEESLPALISALKSDVPAVSRNAAYAFNNIGSPAVPYLLNSTRDENERVRARALDILGDMGLSAGAALAGLTDALLDEAPDPRRRAAEALGVAGQQSGGFGAALGARLENDENGEVRRNAALSLARLGPDAGDALSALEKGLMDSNHYVRGYSVHALSRIGTPAANEILLGYLQTLRWDWEQH